MLLSRSIFATLKSTVTTRPTRSRNRVLASQLPGNFVSQQKRFRSDAIPSSSGSRGERLSFRSVEKPSPSVADGLSFSQARKRKPVGLSGAFGPNATPEQISDTIISWLEDHKVEYKRAPSEPYQLQIKDCPYCHDTGGKAANQHKLYVYLQNATLHCFRCSWHGNWPQFVSQMTDDASGAAEPVKVAPTKAAAAPKSAKRISIASNSMDNEDEMPEDETPAPPKPARAKAASSASSRIAGAVNSSPKVSRPLMTEDDEDPGDVFVTPTAQTAATRRAPSTASATKSRAPAKQSVSQSMDEDAPPFDEDEAAAFAAEQKSFESATSRSAAPRKPVTSFSSGSPNIIPTASGVARQAPPREAPAASAVPAAPRKRFTTAEVSSTSQRDMDPSGDVPVRRAAQPSSAAPAASTSGKFVAQAPVEDSASLKLPDQNKMNKHISNLRSEQLLEVFNYLTQERGLTEDTLNIYRVGACVLRIKDSAGGDSFTDHPCVSFGWFQRNPENPSGDLLVTRIKTRSLKQKSLQRLDPVGGKWGMFGWHLIEEQVRQHGTMKHSSRSSSKSSAYKSIIITEGEFDAMAVYQATGEIAVSLPAGANCFPVDVLEMLEPFERIIIWMDDDLVGQEGARKLANKLGKERCQIIQTRQGQKEGPKDANDALKAGLDLKDILATAKPIPHQQLLHFNELRDEVRRELANPDQVAGTKSTTFPTLTKILKGHRKGELTVFTGPTGIGKTSILSQLSMDFASQGIATLWGSFEIQNHRLAKKMLLQMSKTNLEKDISQFTEFANKFEELPLYFLRFHGGTEVDQVLDAMEYAVYVHDVEHIILDNLQFMTPTHLMKGFDKFDLLDTCVSKLRKFATYRNVHVTIIIHPRKEDDGQVLTNASVFGSAKATQEADNVVIVQRGKAYRYLEVTKNRFSGDLGLVPYKYDQDANFFTEMTQDEVKEAEKANAKSRAAKRTAAIGSKPKTAADGLPITAPWMLPDDSAPSDAASAGFDLS